MIRQVLFIGFIALLCTVSCSPSEQYAGTLPENRVTPQLSGTNWDGTPYSLADASGHLALVFFGYTYCPDVCPLALAKMKQLYTVLGDDASKVDIVFVSVDPHRDTVEKLSQYVPNFDSRFKGLYLDPGQMEAATDSFDLTVQFSQPQDGPGTDSFYYVDHTGTFFLVGTDGRLALTYPPSTTVDMIAPDIQRLLS